MARPKQHNREQIHDLALAAAEEIIAEHGLAGLNVRKVAGAIGCAVGTLYLVFDNLDDLILQVNARTLDAMYDFVSQASCCAPPECVSNLGRAYLAFAQSHPHRWRAIFEYNRPPDTVVPPWYRKKIMRLFALVEDPLSRLAPGSADPARQARVLWGAVHGVCILGLSQTLEVVGAGAMREMLDTLIETYLAGLRARA